MARSAQGDLLARLEGRPCNHCEDGTLERSVYKGNGAVVCDECEMPHAQLW